MRPKDYSIRLLFLFAVCIAMPLLAWGATPAVEWRMDSAGWLEPLNGQTTVDLLNTGDVALDAKWINASRAAMALAPAIPGQAGTCGYAQINGTESYIDAGRPDLGLTDQLTVMAWVRWDIQPGTGQRGASIVSLSTGDWWYDGQFWLQHDYWRNRFEFVIRTDKGKRRVRAPWLYQPVEGRWYHLAGVYDGAYLKLYVDGVLVRSRRHQGVFQHKNTFKLQAGRRTSGENAHRAFHGVVDELRVYNEALSDTGIRQAIGTRRDCDPAFADHQAPSPAPVMALHMDEPGWRGESGEVIDSSDHAWHGTAINGATT